eukprot:TRINITY_DN834_c0_g7_i1.p1 TRINITY_DN834_c0_g7~~TRINITY_DN834_c0_g7_i1.p1  ORF type:complete len:304 (+),score=31.23 TRINITY_DN834_c0_g7_i1:372-1283(+)
MRGTAALRMVFNPNVSTSEMYKVAHSRYTPRYEKQRKEVDYGHHCNYTLERQMLQDRIIDSLVPRRMETDEAVREPWLVFSAGAMGAGKTRTLHWMAKHGHFPLMRFAFLDNDAVKYMLPEMWLYQQACPDGAGTMTQQEAGFIIEIAKRRCLEMGVNCLVDGSLRNSQWYKNFIEETRAQYSQNKIGIIHVKADESCVKQRARDRALITGRHIPAAVLDEAIMQVPTSVKELTPEVDLLIEVDNSGALPPRLDTVAYPRFEVTNHSPDWETVSTVFDDSTTPLYFAPSGSFHTSYFSQKIVL